MVARFVNGKSMRGMLHYNENKVAQGVAKLILASGFAGEATNFSLEQKLKRFEMLTQLNIRVKTNAIHISLNFDPQDKPGTEKLQQIAMAYMERIGFGDQPYLVYQHTDAAHRHVHIATVNIKTDGSRIDTHGIGWRLSEPARMAIEKDFGLVAAKGKTLSNQPGIKPADIGKAVYGQALTKRAITNIVNAVIRDYRFTSLAEFNAVLRQFNVAADGGSENTVMRKKGGLLYSLVNAKGESVGVPIKASTIYNQPTLKNLQKEFEHHAKRRQSYREPLKYAIEQILRANSSLTKNTFIRELQKQNINVLFRTNEQGLTYGVTFIDNRNRVVFNGSDLGKAYGAKALTQRFDQADQLQAQIRLASYQRKQAGENKRPPVDQKAQDKSARLQLNLGKYQPQVAPLVSRRKKKRKGQDQELTL